MSPARILSGSRGSCLSSQSTRAGSWNIEKKFVGSLGQSEILVLSVDLVSYFFYRIQKFLRITF